MRRVTGSLFTLLFGLLLWSSDASAFCGFYVGKADTKLFNKASDVAIARHDNKTVITMANDFKGDVKEPYLNVDAAAIIEVCRFLRNSPGFRFEVLSDLTAVDWPKEEKIQVVYHLFSYSQNHQIVLKVDLPRDNPKIATLEDVWTCRWCRRSPRSGARPTGSSARRSICTA